MRKFVKTLDYKPSEGRVMDNTRIVDTGTYQSRSVQINNMRNAGLALSVLRQQLMYGDDLRGMDAVTRTNYMEKLEVLAQADRMNARLRDLKAKLAKQKADAVASAANEPKANVANAEKQSASNSTSSTSDVPQE